MWMIRTPGGKYAGELLEQGIVGIGWAEIEKPLSTARTIEDFYARVRETFPDYTDQQVVNAANQLFKFVRVMEVGNVAMTYDSPNRTYHIGTIAGDAEWDPSQPDYRTNFRRMKWLAQVERDKLSPAARNSLGSSLTIFEPSGECSEEIIKLIEHPEKAPEPDTPPVALEVEAEDPFVAAMENSRELIKDKMMRLSWQDMQALVAGILRAMGYKTKISPEGADRGKDVIASPDGLGLEQPRIFVEVKHRRGTKIGAPDIRKFIGGRDAAHDRCLYVSTGGSLMTPTTRQSDRACPSPSSTATTSLRCFSITTKRAIPKLVH
jgi:restriction system protein